MQILQSGWGVGKKKEEETNEDTKESRRNFGKKMDRKIIRMEKKERKEDKRGKGVYWG